MPKEVRNCMDISN